jgi:hypothetical protein
MGYLHENRQVFRNVSLLYIPILVPKLRIYFRLLPSGSDHSKSHIGPSWGTSCFLSIVRIWSSVCIEGDKPPWTQKIWKLLFEFNCFVVYLSALSSFNFWKRQRMQCSVILHAKASDEVLANYRLHILEIVSQNFHSVLIAFPIIYSGFGFHFNYPYKCFITGKQQTNKQTPWSESASELYRPSDRCL